MIFKPEKNYVDLNCVYIMRKPNAIAVSNALTHSVQQRAVGNPLAAST